MRSDINAKNNPAKKRSKDRARKNLLSLYCNGPQPYMQS